jgi:hypothetical protein
MSTRSQDTGPPARAAEAPSESVLCVWLTREEVEALITLCAASPGPRHPGEQELLLDLGQLYRAFQR